MHGQKEAGLTLLQNSTRGLGHESCGGRKEGVSRAVIEPLGWSTYRQGPKSSTETADKDQSVWDDEG